MLKALCEERITNRKAAAALHLSVRQIQRLKARYHAGGAAAVVHRGRGQPSARRLAAAVREQVAALMTTIYAGFNDAHLTEKLREVHGLAVSRPTVRRIRSALGRSATRRRRARPYRQRRLREAAAGSLVQINGSSFDWLQGRGPILTLHGAIDDARLLVFADARLVATQPAPPTGFTLKPRRGPSADRRSAHARVSQARASVSAVPAPLPQGARGPGVPYPIIPGPFTFTDSAKLCGSGDDHYP